MNPLPPTRGRPETSTRAVCNVQVLRLARHALRSTAAQLQEINPIVASAALLAFASAPLAEQLKWAAKVRAMRVTDAAQAAPTAE